MKRVYLLAAVLAMSCLYATAGGASRAKERTWAVIIDYSPDRDISAPGVTNTFHASLGLQHLTDYFMFAHGQSHDVFIKEATSPLEAFAARYLSPAYTNVIYLSGKGEFSERDVVVRDSRRRQRFERIGGFLTFELAYRHYRYEDSSLTLVERGVAREEARKNWLEPIGAESDALLDSLILTTPEPEEFVIQRAVEKALSFVPAEKVTYDDDAPGVQVVLHVDSSYIRANGSEWETRVNSMVRLASRSFRRQFGIGLRLKSTIVFAVRDGGDASMSQLYRSIADNPDTNRTHISVYLFNRNNNLEYFLGDSYDRIGLTEIGKNQIVINELPRPRSSYSFWTTYNNSLTLIHEIGHSLGAIHVSDANSVMSHHLSWLATDQFDPFNARMIKSELYREGRMDDAGEYLRLLCRTLEETSYGLVDYPEFIYRIVRIAEPSGRKRLQGVVERKSYLIAARAFGFMVSGQRDEAAAGFSQAIREDPHQASLYYYLSKVTLGEISAEALRKSAELGYYRAQLEFQRQFPNSSGQQ